MHELRRADLLSGCAFRKCSSLTKQ